ncbi:acyloxyacyl hydrolase [Spartinivicinus poritis]|uniref:Acyloxyacyl hydrolase n=1 Tax=Spartinivicinus poritis TaxID=2994640 RepID=A0ABT5UDS5_9GAMM|nr:acyloxyacyl hydrolase [Spartinivicinus sp. A2-2]MDE1464531.1 acyloxyacyl hydrolase [Spartinivicinus sp. A2-2]
MSQYDLGMIGISKDVALLSGTNTYLAVGLGIYLKEKKTNRIGSKFTFGERLALGYRFDSGIAMELYARHFSNAGITDDNSGQNFAGLSIGYTF